MPDFSITPKNFGTGAPKTATINPSTAFQTPQPTTFQNGKLPEGFKFDPATAGMPNPLGDPGQFATPSVNPQPPVSSTVIEGAGASSSFGTTGYRKDGVPVRQLSKAGNVQHFTIALYNSLEGKPLISSVVLNINPEDFVIENPYRVNAVQTLDGAFMDVWGEGIRRVTMRGHTGWRTKQSGNQRHDGYDNIFALRDNIVNKYFKLRREYATKITQSDLEEKLQLHIIDKLHNQVYVVVPENFRLFRNKARPLLHMYEASFFMYKDMPPKEDPLSKANEDRQKTEQAKKEKGFWGKIGDKLKDYGKEMKGDFGQALKDLTTKGGGLGGFMQNIANAKGDLMQGVGVFQNAMQGTFFNIRSVMGTIQSFADFSQLGITGKLAWFDAKSLMKDAERTVNMVKTGGFYTYTGHVGTGYAAPTGSLESSLQDAKNSIELLANQAKTDSIQQATNDVNTDNSVAVKKLKMQDIPLHMAGKD